MFDGARKVDLPNELSLRFEEPVAVAWSQHVMRPLRDRTHALADDYDRVARDIVELAVSQSRCGDAGLANALRQNLQSDTDNVRDIGTDEVEKLRGEIKTELYERVEAEVRAACQKFVTDGKAKGAGVKARVLRLIDRLADTVVDAAAPLTRDILLERYERVATEVGDAMNRLPDPIESTTGAILSGGRDTERSDAEGADHGLSDRCC